MSSSCTANAGCRRRFRGAGWRCRPLDLGADLETCLAPAARTELYRIAQLAHDNVVEDARAAHVQVEIHASRGRVESSIADDGLGFSEATRQAGGHFGLTSMQARAASTGGELIVTSLPGQGTRQRLAASRRASQDVDGKPSALQRITWLAGSPGQAMMDTRSRQAADHDTWALVLSAGRSHPPLPIVRLNRAVTLDNRSIGCLGVFSSLDHSPFFSVSVGLYPVTHSRAGLSQLS